MNTFNPEVEAANLIQLRKTSRHSRRPNYKKTPLDEYKPELCALYERPEIRQQDLVRYLGRKNVKVHHMQVHRALVKWGVKNG